MGSFTIPIGEADEYSEIRESRVKFPGQIFEGTDVKYLS